MNKFNFNLVD